MPRADEGTGELVARNTIINAAGRALNVVLSLALTPIMLHRLGDVDYGVWVLATGLTFTAGYLSIAELGFMQAVVRRIAESRAVRDFEAASTTASSSTALYACVGVLLAVGLAASAPLLATAFSLPPRAEALAVTVFAVIGLQIAIDLPAASVMSILEGSQRYGTLRAIEACSRLAWFVGCVVVLATEHGLVTIAGVSIAAAVITLVVSWVASRKLEPAIRLSRSSVRKSAIRRLGVDAPPLLALRVLLIVYAQMDRVIIGVVLGAAAVTDYEIAYKVHSAAALILGVAPSAVMPAAAYLAAGGEHERVRELFERGTRYASGIAIVLCVGVGLFAGELISGWLGPQYASLAGPTRLFLVYPALASMLVVGQTILIGRNEMGDVLRLQSLAVALNLAASLALVRVLGVVGVIAGTLIGNAVLWPASMRVFLRHFDAHIGHLLKVAVLPLVPVVVVQAASAAVLMHVLPSGTLVGAIVGLGLNLVLGLGALVLLLPGRERTAVLKLLLRRPARLA